MHQRNVYDQRLLDKIKTSIRFSKLFELNQKRLNGNRKVTKQQIKDQKFKNKKIKIRKIKDQNIPVCIEKRIQEGQKIVKNKIQISCSLLDVKLGLQTRNPNELPTSFLTHGKYYYAMDNLRARPNTDHAKVCMII